MARGGVRSGTPGRSYQNRTDLGVAKLPASAAPGQIYGVQGAQIAAQQVMPMAAQPSAVPNAGAPPTITPGSLGPLTAPTQRPTEPVTTGAVGGLGAGPEILPNLNTPQAQYQTGRDMLASMSAAQPDNAALAYLAGAASRGL